MAVNKINTINNNIYDNFRNNFIMGALGVNKTGKSSTFKTIAESWRGCRNSSKYKIVGHDPQRIFHNPNDLSRGLITDKNHLINPEDKNWAVKCCKLRNCLLILDEIRILCPTPQHPPKGLVTLFSQCFYWNIDIMWMTHNPSLVPEVCTYYTTHYYIFLTFAREGQFQKKIPNYSLCTAASNYVNRYAKKHGRGKHKLDKFYEGQGFPYAIVNTETQEIKGINMNNKMV